MSQEQVYLSQEQVYLKGFNKVENFVLFPDQPIITLNTISFSDNPWLSDSDTGQDIDENTEYMTLHLKSIHSFNFWQEESEPNTGGGGEG